jgi:GTPase SAR1 and related small G proteins
MDLGLDMPVINQVKREITYKIVYYGTGLGGKTTNLKFIYSSIHPDYRGQMVSMATATERTLFFDYLLVNVPTANNFQLKLSLYTVPGQEEYFQSRKVILRGVDGIVFVADSSSMKAKENCASLEEMGNHVHDYNMSLDKIPLVLQYNKRDLTESMPVEEMDSQLNKLNVPSYASIAIQGQEVMGTLKGITGLVISKFATPPIGG